jgi:hypothetical protein
MATLAESFLDDDERWDLEAEYKEAFQLYYDKLFNRFAVFSPRHYKQG